MNVCVVAACDLAAPRGSPMRIRRRVALHREAGIATTVLAYRPSGPTPGLPVDGGRFPLPVPTQAGFSWRKPLLDVVLAVRALRWCRRHQPDVIEGHVHEGLAVALLARLGAPGARVVYDAHGTLADELVADGHVRLGGRSYRAVRAAERWLVRRADAVLAQSEHRRAELVADGVPAERVWVLPDAPDPLLVDAATPPDRAAHVANGRRARAVYTGSLAPYQGVDDILHAARLTPNVEYVVFGSPSGEYPKLARHLGVHERVTFVDPAPREALAAVLRDADIALAPRRYGGNVPGKLPIYLAAGLPTVGTDVPGVAELVDETCGVLVPPRRPDALAAAVNDLAADPARRLALGQRARQMAAERYGVRGLVATLREAYS